MNDNELFDAILLISDKKVYLTKEYKKKHKCSESSAMLTVIQSETYEKLRDYKTGYYTKPVKSLLSLLEAELKKKGIGTYKEEFTDRVLSARAEETLTKAFEKRNEPPLTFDDIAEPVGKIKEYLIKTYQEKHNCSADEAKTLVESTDTYDALIDPESCFFEESPESVMNMMEAELSGDEYWYMKTL